MFRLLTCLLCLIPAQVGALEFVSDEQKTTVVELYTSEGCSSCPPADNWLASLKSDPRLFKTLIPLAFHVDYWDQLGWPDRFASSEHSKRQRELVRQGILSQVYTPGIVVNSREWRGWFKGRRDIDNASGKPGRLTADFSDGQLQIRFPGDETYTAHIAVLGMGLSTEVEAGENHGRTLNHDFVVLDSWQQTANGNWQLSLADLPEQGQQRTALAIWLTEPGSLAVIQATGGYLD